MLKAGDTVLYEFQVAFVEDTDGDTGIVTEVSTGAFISSGSILNNSIRPLTKRNLVISKEFEHYSNRIHKFGGKLNFPDIHRHLVSLWKDACDTDPGDKEIYGPVRSFFETINDSITELRYKTIQGIQIYR